jgi:hypothetical protein
MRRYGYYCSIVLGLSVIDAWVAIPSLVEPNHRRRSERRSWITTKASAPSALLRLAAGNDNDTVSKQHAAASADAPMVYYQRVLYRFTPLSEVDIPNAIVVEERCRFLPPRQGDGAAVPVGPRTLILRDGQVDDGEIGDELFTFQCGPATHDGGAGTDRGLETSIATAMFLAGNPDLCHGSLLQVGASHGLESLLGCVGAAVSGHRRAADDNNNKVDDVAQDILTISKKADGLFPNELKLLTISDASTDSLEAALRLANAMGVPQSKLNFAELNWRVRHVPTGRLHRGGHPEFSSMIAAGLSFTFPEAKSLARTIAHYLQPSSPALTSADRQPVPRFAIVTPEWQADCLVDLRHLLERGYKMATATQYLKVEKIAFQLQKTTQPESTLDDLDLEVSEVREVPFTALTAQHHPEYTGGGSGELFFPMETGAYDNQSSGEAALRDAGASPW